jgi:Holliday junction DNA helicase RuvA
MIAYLEGKIIAKDKNSVVVLAGNGIGYEVRLIPPVALKLKENDQVKFFTHFQVRDDAQELYGLTSAQELQFFKLLISVNGVGPKSALHIMALGSLDEIKNAIANKDLAFLTKVSGVGRKTAERIIVELKDKMDVLAYESNTNEGLGDVIDALTGMGYSLAEAREAVKKLQTTGDAGEQLKAALKILNRT